MKKILLIVIFLLTTQSSFSNTTFQILEESKKTSYLDFILLKIEQRLIQRHGMMGAQLVPVRVQYQSIASQVDYLKEKSKIKISIVGVMNKKRYSEKKYRPKMSDCNILRNILLYGKHGYTLIFPKRNKYLTDAIMEDIFVSRFLNNLSLSADEKEYIMKNTITSVKIIDPVRGNDVFCSGKITEELD